MASPSAVAAGGRRARREVAFATEDGTTLRGVLHAPCGAPAPAPAVVMTHGFSGVVEQIEHYAAAFADAGLAALAYDHRGFGRSDGLPRLEVEPHRQLADWRDAITFAGTLPEVDAGRGVGVWGSSFAGGLAMVLGADDPRVTCVVAQIPNVSGHRNGPRMFNVAERAALRTRMLADRTARLSGAPPATIPVLSDDPGVLAALPPEVDARAIAAAEAAAPTWRNEVTLRSLEHALAFEPAGWVPHVAPTPLLMVVAAGDTCTFPELQLDVFATAREPKRLVLHPAGHFETYTAQFARTSDAAAEWFAEHLLG
jgi:hypothetical protein